MNETNLAEKIKREKLPVVIFGAATVGEALYLACREAGINVECFCDNNANKVGKELRGIEIIHAPKLKERYKDAVFLISAADIKDIVEQLTNLGYSKWHACSLLLRNFNIYLHEFSVPADFVEYAIATSVLCHDSYMNPDKLFLRSVDIIITEKCSLRCRDCSNLMRYYKNPSDCGTEELIKEIDRFCSIADEINEFRVLGGEPFMNQNSHLIIKRLIDEPKAKKVVIYTNGTIIPRDEQIEYFRSRKMLFIITDYGKLSSNLNGLTQKLSRNNISYYVQKPKGWTDCAKIMKHSRNLEQQKEIFRNCCAKNTITLTNGKLHRCPFSANVSRLRAAPDFKSDYVDIFENIEIGKIKEKARKLLLEKKFLNVCDFCNGRSFEDKEIEPAVQADKPIEYHKYF